MGAIFGAAGGVVIWLGEEDSGTAAAMELPKRIRHYWPSLLDTPSELTDDSNVPPECPRWGEGAWVAFIALLSRPWFRRLWVIQEVVCAKTILVTCGRATAFWDDFVKLVRVVEATHYSSIGATSTLGAKTAAQYINFMEELRSITEQGTKQAVRDYANEESMVPYVLTMAKDCEATDHRDKLFAFHHIVRLWTRPDYGMQIEMLYKLFAAQYLQRIAYAVSEFSCDEVTLLRRQMDFISSAGICNQQLQLPSWVPDWSTPWKTRPLWLNSTCYAAGGTDVKELNPLMELDSQQQPILHLPLTVKIADRVLSVGTEGFRIDESEDQTLAEALRAWLFRSQSLLHKNRNRPNMYPDQHIAMARTIFADQDQGKKLSEDDAVRKYNSLLEFLRLSEEGVSETGQQEVAEYERLYFSVASFLRGRVFFLTEKGYFGLAQEGVCWGDKIAIVQGAPIPLIIRETLPTRSRLDYRLVCETFVLGMMDGEVWNDAWLTSEEISLV